MVLTARSKVRVDFRQLIDCSNSLRSPSQGHQGQMRFWPRLALGCRSFSRDGKKRGQNRLFVGRTLAGARRHRRTLPTPRKHPTRHSFVAFLVRSGLDCPFLPPFAGSSFDILGGRLAAAIAARTMDREDSFLDEKAYCLHDRWSGKVELSTQTTCSLILRLSTSKGALAIASVHFGRSEEKKLHSSLLAR